MGIASLTIGAHSAHAQTVQYLLPGTITTTIPSGSNNPTGAGGLATNPYVDDVYLTGIQFGSGTSTVKISNTGAGAYGSRGQFGTVKYAFAVLNPGNFNAEFGDQDTSSDGDSNPFVKAGVATNSEVLTGDPNTKRESMDPKIQLPAIAAAFNSMSLTEGVDGEENAGTPNFAYDLVFSQGIAADGRSDTPELLFFERGRNSQYSVQVITGFSSATGFTFTGTSISIDSSNTAQAKATGIFIDTIEIGGGQELGATGLSLSSFGMSTGQVAYGVRITSLNNSGADLYGAFLSAADTSQFRAGLVMPEPSSGGLLVGIVVPGASFLVRRSRRVKRGINPG